MIIIARLVQLQIINPEKFDKEAEKNSIKTIITTPARGLMFDRNNRLLVDNKPSYTVTITKSEFDTANISLIASLLGTDAKFIRENLRKIEGTNRFMPARIMRDVDFSVIAFIEENRDILKGVDYSIEPIRLYPTEFRASHLIGYTKEISEAMLKKQEDDYYRQGDLIGTTGLEAGYEKYLRGEKGYKFILQDYRGREVGQLNDGANDIKPVSGMDLILSIDSEVQKYAEQLLEGKTGGIVAIDPNNGEIICLVSKPDFDLNHFSGKLSPKVWTALNTDPLKPLFNRATQSKYPPGSTYKMVSAIASLQEGIMKPSSTIFCGGSFKYGDKVFKDHGATGNTGFITSIEKSSNVFYYKLVLMIGLDNWNKYGRMFGFGEKTGIDIPEETRGLLPSTEYYNKVYGPKGWTQGYVVSLGIGQGELGVSPLQMAVYTSILANGGTFYQPHIVRYLKNPYTGEVTPVSYRKHELPVNKEYFKIIQRGMYLVVQGNGTARKIRTPLVDISGKTGTAQNPHGRDHSWFIAYAPSENPRIAICVMVENAGFGAAVAAPIAQRIILKYLFGVTNESQLENVDGD